MATSIDAAHLNPNQQRRHLVTMDKVEYAHYCLVCRAWKIVTDTFLFRSFGCIFVVDSGNVLEFRKAYELFQSRHTITHP
jgi:hypothetical protein